MMMSKYKMEIYMVPTGAVGWYDWKTEQDFRAVEAFLLDLLGPAGRSGRTPGRPDFYYVETEQQRQAFFDFLGTFRRSRPGSNE
jgi:hypothetical protein